MLKTLEWDTLQLRRQVNRLSLLHKTVHGQVAIPAQQFLLPVNRPTRRNNSAAFIRPRANKSCYQDSFFPRTIPEWNILPDTIINITDSEAFKRATLTHLKNQ